MRLLESSWFGLSPINGFMTSPDSCPPCDTHIEAPEEVGKTWQDRYNTGPVARSQVRAFNSLKSILLLQHSFVPAQATSSLVV